MNAETGWEEYFESFEKLGNKKCNKIQKQEADIFSQNHKYPLKILRTQTSLLTCNDCESLQVANVACFHPAIPSAFVEVIVRKGNPRSADPTELLTKTTAIFTDKLASKVSRS